MEGEDELIKHNKYYEDKVQSLAFKSAKGHGTVGVVKPGQYQFDTEDQEKIYIISGVAEVKIPGEEVIELREGQSVEIEANMTYNISAKSDVVFVCFYN